MDYLAVLSYLSELRVLKLFIKYDIYIYIYIYIYQIKIKNDYIYLLFE